MRPWSAIIILYNANEKFHKFSVSIIIHTTYTRAMFRVIYSLLALIVTYAIFSSFYQLHRVVSEEKKMRAAEQASDHGAVVSIHHVLPWS